MKHNGLLLILSLLIIISCKKGKRYTVRGKVLVSRSNPLPVRNTDLQLYQGGSGGAPIALGTFSSSANGRTDDQGNFAIEFKDGGGTFIGIPISNGGALTLSGSGSNGGFYITNLVNAVNKELNPLYLYKTIDTVFVRMISFTPVIASDSFRISYGTPTANVQKVRKGFSIPANTEFFLDTIIGASFHYFDYYAKKYENQIEVAKNNYWSPSRAIGMDSLSEQDEHSQTFRYYTY